MLTFCNVLVNEKRGVAKKMKLFFAIIIIIYFPQTRGPYHKHNRIAQEHQYG